MIRTIMRLMDINYLTKYEELNIILVYVNYKLKHELLIF